MMRSALRFTTACLAALALTSPIVAGKKPMVGDLSTVEGRLETAKRLKLEIDASGMKKTGPPVRIAVGDFEVRFNHRDQPFQGMYVYDGHDPREIDVDWKDVHYQLLTDRMYDVFLADLEAAGFDVIPMDIVMASEPYQRLRTEETAEVKEGDLGFTPYGMKDAKLSGVVAFRKLLPWINRQLGSDAVVTVRMEFSVCGLKTGLIFKRKVGYLCAGRVETGFDREGKDKPFEMRFWGGYREQRMLPKTKMLLGPQWENGVVKTFEPTLLYEEAVAQSLQRGWFDLGAEPDLRAYADGAIGMFDALVRAGLTAYRERSP